MFTKSVQILLPRATISLGYDLYVATKLAALMEMIPKLFLPISKNIVRSTPPCMHTFKVYDVSILPITKH